MFWLFKPWTTTASEFQRSAESRAGRVGEVMRHGVGFSLVT